MSRWLLLPLLLPFLIPAGAAQPLPVFGRGRTFCHVLRSSPGLRYLSFLHRGPAGLALYQSTWAPGGQGRLRDCAIREDAELVRFSLSACREGIRSEAGPPRSLLRTLGRSRHRCSRGPGGREPPARGKRQLQEAPGAARRRTRRGWTMPGTLWCGAGDSAGNFTDLGIFSGADVCCREHDHCAERLTALEFNYGIRNYRLHTISHCDCDYRFKQCLHDVNDTISTFVGITFFNLLEMPCLVLEEKEECMDWQWWGGCKKYGPVPFAEIKKQGNYNYTHPFSDKLDERYRPNRTDPDAPAAGSSTALTSLGVEREGASSPDLGERAPRPDRKERRKQKKNRKHLLQEMGRSVDEEPKLVQDLPATKAVSLPPAPESPQPHIFSNHLDELEAPHGKKPQTYAPTENQEVWSNGSSINAGKLGQQDSEVPGLNRTGMKEGFSQLPVKSPPSESKASANVRDESVGNISHHSSAPSRHIHKDKISQRYISKSCGCYRRLDQCEYKIAPNEMKFQVRNLDRKTLFHCNCTRRLARFLRRQKGPNEVEEVLSDFVSPSCFVLEPLVACKKEQETETNCTSLPTAVLSEARHLQRAMKLLQKDRALPRAPGKVKRQDQAPLKLYDTCLQRLGASVGQQEDPQTPPH
ncbi:group 3 secretory phospholipase A2 [Rhinatrema bivittatum]|uniref:group 3 secretory phospholipase A2 n=1 Tax=Rhinatrema bivittatum TaxID=194408 RepID=UPI00112CBEE6|nr:group 3 secretory phospholipase A2 [Rhinatrema bivittatum]